MDNDHQSAQVEFLSGEKVYLRPVEPGDFPLFYKWANDPETRGLNGETRPSSFAALQEFYENGQKEMDRVWLAVVVRATHQVIGETGLLRMFPAWRTTDWSLIIGDKAARCKGYGTEAVLVNAELRFLEI